MALKTFLTDDVLYNAFRCNFPWPPKPERSVIMYKADTNILKECCFPTLQRLSSMTQVDVTNSIMEILPAPSTSEFPILALGLLQLLDQIPRELLSGPAMCYT